MIEQKNRYSDEERKLIQSLFKDGEVMLVLLRRFILQDELDKDQEEYLRKTLNHPEIIHILRKTLNPPVDKAAVIGGTVDLFSSMDLAPTPVDHAILQIKIRKLASQFLDERLLDLEGKAVKNPIIFDELLEGKDDEELYIHFVARNFLLGFLDNNGLRQLMILADKEESPEQVAKRLKDDSAK